MGIEIKGDVTFSDLKTGKEIKLTDRNTIIEECAQVVEQIKSPIPMNVEMGNFNKAYTAAAAAIRALKDKP